MKFQPLEPWIMGNNSVNPMNFYGKLEPYLEYGAFIGLDVCCDLYLANSVDAGYLYDSWKKINLFYHMKRQRIIWIGWKDF